MSSHLQSALTLAQQAAAQDEVPIGCVIVHDGNVIASGHNLIETTHDPSAHAEIVAIREASAKLKTRHLTDCDLYVTLEPCAMCATAISFARIRRLYFGAYDPKGGGVEHGARIYAQPTCHHTPEVVGGLMESECGNLLKDFFKGKR